MIGNENTLIFISTTYDVLLTIMDGRLETFIESMSRDSVKTGMNYRVGLGHFSRFLLQKNLTLNAVLDTADIYPLLDGFISHLLGINCKARSIRTYVAGVRSYLEYNNVEISERKFNRRVKLPKIPDEDEKALDIVDIRNILLNIHNRRLKAFCECLACGGFRDESELGTTRFCDVHFETWPAYIHVRAQPNKIKKSRNVWITDEAAKFLKDWIDWRIQREGIIDPNDLVFRSKGLTSLDGMIRRLRGEFNKVLDLVGLGDRKEGMKRRKITMHSFRRYVYQLLTDNVNEAYARWFVGKKKSEYYTKKESEKRQIYVDKCMLNGLTFLDYTVLDRSQKEQKTEIQYLQSQVKELSEDYEYLVQMYEHDPQEQNKLKKLYREAEKNGTLKPGQMLYLKKSEYTPNSFASKAYGDMSDE